MFLKKELNTAWLWVIFGALIECFWVSGLKYSYEIWHYCLTAIGIFISFNCFLKACKKIEISVAYSVFVGIGTAGIVIAEIAIFHEKFSILKIFFILLLLLGVIGLKFSSKEN
ncbi:QacE family quaternary ammonium compound efflux SMR transporter [Campylobacter sp. 2457A]|nr:QacE family quaternary ammonium compound efflux SMR transporter [Campylobacter sp. 2457A]